MTRALICALFVTYFQATRGIPEDTRSTRPQSFILLGFLAESAPNKLHQYVTDDGTRSNRQPRRTARRIRKRTETVHYVGGRCIFRAGVRHADAALFRSSSRVRRKAF